MNQSYYDEIIQDEKKVAAFMRQQLSGETITLFGPTSSAKSTCTTELLPPASNKLLGKNVGDTAQTSLIPTVLMLNSRFNDNEVMIQCIRRKTSMLTDFMDSVKNVITISMYNERDNIDEFKVDNEIVRQILNPVNRIFHAYHFAEANQFTQELAEILSSACETIVNGPEPLDKAANTLFKINRQKNSKYKKKDAYEQIVDERLSADKETTYNLKHWYTSLENMILDDLQPFWSFPDNFTLLDRIADSCSANKLMDKLYGEESACSLVFEEVRYATSPSNGFREEYEKRNENKPERTVKINIVDTVGLTQTSQEREDISDNLDVLLRRDSDALLFLCASDEQPTVYETCITLLTEKKKDFETKPVTICRTKADIIIRNIMMNSWRRDTGTNNILEDSPEYKEYLTNAFDSFLSEQINNPRFGETELGKVGETRIDFLSTAPDLTARMNKHLDNKLSSTRVFTIVLDLAQKVDNIYATSGSSRLWLQSTDLLQYPLNAMCYAKPLSKTIALAMTAKNNQEREQQYRKYIDVKDVFHGRSVNCFRRKLSYGVGHETNAVVYTNFRLYITNMVARWLRDVLPEQDLINDFDVSFKYLRDSKQADEARREIPMQFKRRLHYNWSNIIDRIAKKLAYDCLDIEFENAYHFCSWDAGFRRSLEVINNKFSSEDYWGQNILPLLNHEGQEILQKMYIYD